MRHARRCRVTLAVALVTGGLAAAVVFAPAAYAGEWIQVSCANPDQSPAPSAGWTGFAGGGPGNGSNNSVNCAPASPMFAMLSTTVAAPVGAAEGLQYTPPGGSTLAGGNIDVSLYANGYGQDASGTAVLYTPAFAYDASDVFFQCAAQLTACSSTGSDFSGVLSLPGGRGGSLYLAAGCGGIAGQACNVGGSQGAWALVRLWWADLLLTNTSAPAATGFSGSLLSPNAHGTADLAFTATDPNGPGVYKITIEIDGKPTYSATPNTNLGACAPVATDTTTGALMFDTQQPCLQTETVDVPVDTTMLTDGQHDLKVIVTDAAQNNSTVLDQTITTLNSTTVSGLLPTPPSSSAEPVYSIALAHATEPLTRGVRRLYTHSSLTLAGAIKNAAGAAAPGVPVTLWAQPANGGPFSELAHTTSDGTGAWTLTAPRGPSRLLKIVAGAHRNAARAASSVSVHETVTPVLSLHVATPGAARIVFTGQLEITPLGQPRPLVFIQTRGPDGWEVVGKPIRVNPTGRFRYVYRSSPLTLDRRFSFRAATPQTALWQPTHSTVQTALVH